MKSQSGALQFLQKRILAFEEEYSKSIEEFSKMEKSNIDLCQVRRNWLSFKMNENRADTSLFEKKILVFQKANDLNRLNLEVDELRLKGYYEAQQLKQLVAATKPTDISDHNGKIRSHALEILRREGMEEIKAALNDSIHLRERLLSECHRVHSMIDTTVLEEDQKIKLMNGNLQDSLSKFKQRLEVVLSTSEFNLKKVTGDYLILRHNAKIAQEILTRSMNESIRERKELKESLKDKEKTYASRLVELEYNNKMELETRLRGLRDEVIRTEAEVEFKYAKNDQLRHNVLNSVKNLKNSRRESNRKYRELQARRREELIIVQGELTRLKHALSQAEDNIVKSMAMGMHHMSCKTTDEEVFDFRQRHSGNDKKLARNGNGATMDMVDMVDMLGGVVDNNSVIEQRLQNLSILKDLNKRLVDLSMMVQSNVAGNET